MGNFGDELRTERLSRGMALEDISAVTKISPRHLVALEQEKFRQLPGGILSKGIVRGYANALGLDQQDWTDRFMRACTASGQAIDIERDWTEFASNVGRARILRHEANQMRLRWIGAAVLLTVACTAAFFTLRYYGVRAGWWGSVLPFHAQTVVHAAASSAHSLVARAMLWIGR